MGTGHNHQAGIVAHPKVMDDTGHQAQNATGLLEPFQRCQSSYSLSKTSGWMG
jgi:hypothetical protein